jgi:hypothetical protein
MPKSRIKPPPRYAVPMLHDDAARVVCRAALSVQAIADRLHREVERLNRRPQRVLSARERKQRRYDMQMQFVGGPTPRPRKPADEKAEA